VETAATVSPVKYADEKRAKEIIQNLYNAIKTGNKTFQMPEK
jgi:hypothetical protein